MLIFPHCVSFQDIGANLSVVDHPSPSASYHSPAESVKSNRNNGGSQNTVLHLMPQTASWNNKFNRDIIASTTANFQMCNELKQLAELNKT